MTRVSIVVNNHDYARYLPTAIDSALAQDWPDVETIVVDDGSTDGSREVIAGYGDRVVPVLQANRGQIPACAAGLAVATGELVLFLDADDVLLPTATRTAAGALAAAPDAVRISWPLWEIDGTGERTGRLRPPEPLDRGDLRARVVEQGPDSYISSPTSGNAWTRGFLHEVLPADDDELRLGIDAYLSVLAPLFGPLAVVDEPQSLYRAHGENHYWRSSLEHRVTSLLDRYPSRVRALTATRRRLGETADDAEISSPYYAWLGRLGRVVGTLRETLPPGGTFLLLDNGEWGERLLTDTPHLPFPEREGVFWGAPADDAAAVAELRRQAVSGVEHVVVGWPAFWWLEHYPGLRALLEPLCTTPDVQVYRLRREG